MQIAFGFDTTTNLLHKSKFNNDSQDYQKRQLIFFIFNQALNSKHEEFLLIEIVQEWQN